MKSNKKCSPNQWKSLRTVKKQPNQAKINKYNTSTSKNLDRITLQNPPSHSLCLNFYEVFENLR